MSDALLLLPDIVLIAAGALICHYTALKRPVWDAVERLVYLVLFPALLLCKPRQNSWLPQSTRWWPNTSAGRWRSGRLDGLSSRALLNSVR